MGKVELMNLINADVELLLNKLFVHLALANGITSNPANCAHDPFN
jgi:hypothetical protein